MSDDLVKRLRDHIAVYLDDRGHVFEDEALCDDAADRIEELEAKLAKAVEAAFQEGFLAGTEDGWVNNPRIKMEWKHSRASTTLAELKGETK